MKETSGALLEWPKCIRTMSAPRILELSLRMQGAISQDPTDPTKFFQDQNDPTKVQLHHWQATEIPCIPFRTTSVLRFAEKACSIRTCS